VLQVVEYWEAVLKRLKVYKAQARLRHIHAQLLKEHLARLQASTKEERAGARALLAGARQADLPPVEREGTPEDDIYKEDPVSYSPEPSPEPEAERAEEAGEPEEAGVEGVVPEPIEYDGALSPEPYRGADEEEAVDPEADQLEQVGRLKWVPGVVLGSLHACCIGKTVSSNFHFVYLVRLQYSNQIWAVCGPQGLLPRGVVVLVWPRDPLLLGSEGRILLWESCKRMVDYKF
jgi:hypothetical protein